MRRLSSLLLWVAAVLCLIFAAPGRASEVRENASVAPFVFAARPAILASLTDDEGKWLLTGLGAIGFIVAILVGIKKLREEEPKTVRVHGEVSFVEEPAFKEFTDYVHDKNHEIAGQIQHLELAAEERRTEAAEQSAKLVQQLQVLGDRLDGKRSISVGNLHEQLKSTELKVARVEAAADMHTQQLAAMDQKLTNILQRLPRRNS